MSIFSIKKDPLFAFALSKVKSIRDGIESTEGIKPYLQQNKFLRIIEGESKSPLIMGMGENQHLIYYPENSIPYLHSYTNQYKNVEILHGEVWDKLTGKKYVKGDKFKILPGQEVQPYTLANEAYVRVIVSNRDTLLSVCN